MTFPALCLPGIRHAFSLRTAIPHDQLEKHFLASASALGFASNSFARAEQTHGNGVAEISTPTPFPVPNVDALVTSTVGITLVIRVADCGPVYAFDPIKRVIGLAHSGRKGTEAKITHKMISRMVSTYGCSSKDIIIQLGPCIRPPHYEVDFAKDILTQARDCGVEKVIDCNLSTANNLNDFYSYRLEKGATGRHWALIQMAPHSGVEV